MSRKESEDIFLAAVEKLLLNGSDFGINAVAKEARLNKVLIYRYFGDMDGLLEIYAKSINLWKPIRLQMEEGIKINRWPNGKEAIKWFFKRYRETILSSPIFLRVLKEELYKPNKLTRKLEIEREDEGLLLTKLALETYPELNEVNIVALGAFVASGITYLALKSTQVNIFNGIDLSLEKSWEQFDDLFLQLL
ncbi:MAG: TetR/AcrR family transcriptional regulator [Spirochaetaceae bacterium]